MFSRVLGKIVLSLIKAAVSTSFVSGLFSVSADSMVDYSRFRSLPLPSALLHIQVNTESLSGVLGGSLYKVVVDISENREFVYRGEELIKESYVSTGSATRFAIPYHTPLGYWRIISKEGTSGIYGPYFLRLAFWSGKDFVRTDIGLHGTDEPEFLGETASHGCIRHSNQDIRELFQLLPVGTIVETVE
ncbi:L,D-transpeptidase [Patescibacteria group bacterium]|nr:L,D-transpeptidase [Patescibacteria group bacterium]